MTHYLFKNVYCFALAAGIVLLNPLRGFSQAEILNLESAMEIARENSPDIRSAKISLERSQELLNAQNASLKSQFSLTLNPYRYSNERQFSSELNSWRTAESHQSDGVFNIIQPLMLTDGRLTLSNRFVWRDSRIEYDNKLLGIQDANNKTYSNNLYLSYDQPLFTYNQTKMAFQEVKLDLENSYLNFKIRELFLEQSVTQSFYSAFQRKMSLQVAGEELQNTEQSYQIIKNKVDAGLVAKEELYQAELNLASSKSQVQNARVNLDNALDQFKKLIGMSLYEEISVVAEVTQQNVDIDLDKALEFGLANRLELSQRAIDIQLSMASLARASATNEFKGNIALTYGIIGNDPDLNDIYQSPTKNQNISLALDIPIFDWGEKKSRTKAAQAAVNNQKLSLENEKNDIIIAIREAYRTIQNQTLQIEIARQNVKIAQLTYDINLERYRNGDLTSMDLNLYQNQLSQKKTDLVDAIITQKLALLDLKIQSLWDFEKQQPLLEFDEKN